jgi:hypothetical protein
MGIFTIGFNREVADKGPYYSVSFDWRERQSEEEKQQLELISDFVIACGNQLIDLEATRDLICVDGWTAQQLQALTSQRRELEGTRNQRTLPAS